jgi:hypothetical protein
MGKPADRPPETARLGPFLRLRRLLCLTGLASLELELHAVPVDADHLLGRHGPTIRRIVTEPVGIDLDPSGLAPLGPLGGLTDALTGLPGLTRGTAASGLPLEILLAPLWPLLFPGLLLPNGTSLPALLLIALTDLLVGEPRQLIPLLLLASLFALPLSRLPPFLLLRPLDNRCVGLLLGLLGLTAEAVPDQSEADQHVRGVSFHDLCHELPPEQRWASISKESHLDSRRTGGA